MSSQLLNVFFKNELYATHAQIRSRCPSWFNQPQPEGEPWVSQLELFLRALRALGLDFDPDGRLYYNQVARAVGAPPRSPSTRQPVYATKQSRAGLLKGSSVRKLAALAEVVLARMRPDEVAITPLDLAARPGFRRLPISILTRDLARMGLGSPVQRAELEWWRSHHRVPGAWYRLDRVKSRLRLAPTRLFDKKCHS